LLRLLYEQTYGVYLRKSDAESAQAEAMLSARYSAAKRHIPIDPNYTPET
jgi:hypothetical protein